MPGTLSNRPLTCLMGCVAGFIFVRSRRERAHIDGDEETEFEDDWVECNACGSRPELGGVELDYAP